MCHTQYIGACIGGSAANGMVFRGGAHRIGAVTVEVVVKEDLRLASMDIYRRLVAAFNDGGVDAVLGFFAEDGRDRDPDLPGDGTYRGREALRGVLEQMLSGSETTEVLAYEAIPAGDRVVALTHTYFRGQGVTPRSRSETRIR